jgi:hypothetical protein
MSDRQINLRRQINSQANQKPTEAGQKITALKQEHGHDDNKIKHNLTFLSLVADFRV